MRNLQELQNHCDVEDVLQTINKWTEAKPDNKQLKNLTNSFLRIITYINSKEAESFCFDRIISESMSDKHRALDRAKRAEESLEKLQEENKQLLKKQELGL